MHGPVNSVFGPGDEAGAAKTAAFQVPIPADAAPGAYRVVVDHYDRQDGQWVIESGYEWIT